MVKCDSKELFGQEEDDYLNELSMWFFNMLLIWERIIVRINHFGETVGFQTSRFSVSDAERGV